MQIVLTIFYLTWLIAVLVFLFLIYRQIRSYIQHAEKMTLQSSELSAQAALKAAEAAAKLADMLGANHHEFDDPATRANQITRSQRSDA